MKTIHVPRSWYHSILAISLIAILSGCPSQIPSDVRIGSINADIHTFNEQTIIPWAVEYSGTLTFHGVNALGKLLLDTNFIIRGT